MSPGLLALLLLLSSGVRRAFTLLDILRVTGLINVTASDADELESVVAGIEQAAIQASCETRRLWGSRPRRSPPLHSRSAGRCEALRELADDIYDWSLPTETDGSRQEGNGGMRRHSGEGPYVVPE